MTIERTETRFAYGIFDSLLIRSADGTRCELFSFILYYILSKLFGRSGGEALPPPSLLLI